MKFNRIYFSLSGALIITSIVALFVWGLKPAIDFTGGALLEVGFQENTEVNSEVLEQTVLYSENVQVASIVSTDSGSYIIRTGTIDETKKNEILSNISEQISPAEEVRFETVGPTLGRELLVKTFTAVLVASALIMIYVTYQFKDKVYGLAAILAMVHDSVILLGAFAFFGYFLGVEVDILFVTALLTTLSFSVHDTIVVFDRIRETLELAPGSKPNDVINRAILETLPRSLNNSMTIIFMLTALALLGGITIKWFVVALLIGTVSGTYSSTFTAAPLLAWMLGRKKS